MPLHEVLAVLSKECGRNLICSKEAKDIVIDTYFNKGEDLDSVLGFLAETYGLTMKKENYTSIFMLASEKNSKKAKIIGRVTSNNMSLEGAKIELKDLNKFVYSDKSGNFILDNLDKDVYVCKISKKGYEEKGEIIDSSKSISILNVDLKEKADNYTNRQNETDLEDLNFYEVDGKFYYTKTFSLFNVSPDEVLKVLRETFGENIKVSSLSKVNKLVVSAERDILEKIESKLEIIKKVYGNIDIYLKELEDKEKEERRIYSKEDTKRLLEYIVNYKNGPLEYDEEGNVILSGNLGRIESFENYVLLKYSVRYNDKKIGEKLVSEIEENMEKYNVICEDSSYMLGYEQPKESKLLNIVEKAYIEVMGNIPKKKKSQACLECGYLGQKIENLEYIAIAPNIFDAHSPKERVEIASANKVWNIVEKIIDKI